MKNLQAIIIEFSQDLLMVDFNDQKSMSEILSTLQQAKNLIPDEVISPFEEAILKIESQETFNEAENQFNLLQIKCEEREFQFIMSGDDEENDKERNFDSTDYISVLSEDAELLTTFFEETAENLEALDLHINLWSESPGEDHFVNDIFRCFHTIKGMAGFLSLNDMENTSHALEDLLSQCRDGIISFSTSLSDLLFEGIDFLRVMYEKLVKNYHDASDLKHSIDVQKFVIKSKLFYQDFDSYMVLIEQEAENLENINEEDLEEQEITPQKILKIPKSPQSVKVSKPAKDTKVPVKRELQESFRVSTKKMDSLIDTIGELVISHSLINNKLAPHETVVAEMRDELIQLRRIVNHLQNVSMSLRMVPIGNTFKKMNRVVRDTAHKLGKDIHLVLSGENTEIDRSIVDKIYDPLMHMIRNACDHGIETPKIRRAQGKPNQGTITLSAKHKDGCIVISIEDDGKGLDLEVIREKAIKKDLIKEDEVISKTELHRLILHAGFSTAEKVTNVSGRGVGMDVVVQAINKLRGVLLIDSNEGKGSKLEIRLPLTLAIIDGMIIKIGNQTFIIPTIHIRESVKCKREDYSNVLGTGEMILIRGHLVPLVRVYNLLHLTPSYQDPWEGLLVVIDVDGHRFALMVDELIGKQEIVIKALGEKFAVASWIAGGAILSNGEASLILDVAKLIQLPLKMRTKEQSNEH
ncbi:chemotaxis protein CheA [bacterium]|nr:chemotaxis protein CheA [bacterium]